MVDDSLRSESSRPRPFFRDAPAAFCCNERLIFPTNSRAPRHRAVRQQYAPLPSRHCKASRISPPSLIRTKRKTSSFPRFARQTTQVLSGTDKATARPTPMAAELAGTPRWHYKPTLPLPVATLQTQQAAPPKVPPILELNRFHSSSRLL